MKHSRQILQIFQSFGLHLGPRSRISEAQTGGACRGPRPRTQVLRGRGGAGRGARGAGGGPPAKGGKEGRKKNDQGVSWLIHRND